MKIATYNINSINARLENLMSFLAREQPDIMLLQEIKTEFNAFPFFDLQTIGYEAKILGQKSYNGVAVLSRHKIKVTAEGLPELTVSVYLPNGNPPYNDSDDTSKWIYKLQWMEIFYKHAQRLLERRQPIILGGDFNVILTDADVYDPKLFKNNALFRPEVISRLKAFEYLGYYDAFRVKHPTDNGYTFWDYSGASLQQDNGMRIDYLWLNSYAVDRLETVEVDKSPRLAAKPSDHTVLKAVLK